MLCPNCQKENAENFRYCQFCGSPLTQSLQIKVQELESELRASSSVPTPDTIDAWLADNNIERVSLTFPGENDGNLSSQDDRQADLDIKGRKRVATEDLPLLDEFNATFIPVDPLPPLASNNPPSGLKNASRRMCPNCGELVQEGHRFCGSCGMRYDS